MKKYIGVIFILVALSGTKTICGQDPEFSQTYANPLYLNPAFAGTGNTQRIGLNFRDQWPKLSGNYITYNASFDRSIIDTNNGIGILANMDKSGGNTLTADNISLIYAHQFHIKSFSLSIGAEGTYIYSSLTTSQLSFGDTINPIRGFVYTSSTQAIKHTVNMFDFSGGILGYGKNYFFGFSMYHLTQPNESFVSGSNSPLPLKNVASAGLIIHAGNIIFSPTILFEQQGTFRQTLTECYFTKGFFTVGIGERAQDAIVFILGYQGKRLRIGYSYDYTILNLTNTETGGSHEFSLAVLLPYKSAKLSKSSGINCPTF